jgi:mRNA-degrading endonuclease RelE of RelBE toxin-antitoxin system
VTYELKPTPTFSKAFKRPDTTAQQRVFEEVKALKEAPFGKSKELHGKLKGLRSFRVGGYRVIFQVVGKAVELLTVGPRGSVYD